MRQGDHGPEKRNEKEETCEYSFGKKEKKKGFGTHKMKRKRVPHLCGQFDITVAPGQVETVA